MKMPFRKVIMIALAVLLLTTYSVWSCEPNAIVSANNGLISMGKPVSALGSEAGHGPEFAVDADATNNGYWGSVIGDQRKNTWWQIDLQQPHHISQIVLRTYVDGSRFYHYYIRGSMDGENWYPIAIKGNNSPATNAGDVYDISTAARYIRVNFTRGSANSIAHLTDFKVYGHLLSTMSSPSKIQLTDTAIDKHSYQRGEAIKLTYTLSNQSLVDSYELTGVKVKIAGLTSPYDLLLGQQVLGQIGLLPGQSHIATNVPIWTIPTGFKPGAYAVYLQYSFSDGSVWENYISSFQIASPGDKYVYTIDKELYNGLPVYKLDGDMSTGVVVQKAVASLATGVSHMWETTGGMLTPIHATPSFLVDSVQQTVDLYDQEFGTNASFDTVIIGTGSFGAPYLSRVLKAPFLPTHFLVSADTVQQLKDIHKYASEQGISSYSMFGADGSISKGVAWVELLDLPEAYITFLQNHNVKNILIMGALGAGGESLVRKVLIDDAVDGAMQNNDIYLGYNFAGVSVTQNVANMNVKIKDYNDYSLGVFHDLKDWESGLLEQQKSNYIYTIDQNVPSVTAVDEATAYLWEMASHAMLSFYKKNNIALKGVSINPYMNTHPYYESYKGYIPLLMLQWGTNVNTLIDQQLNTAYRAQINHYFPSVDFDQLDFWVNFTRNAGNNDAPVGNGKWLSEQIQQRLLHNGLNQVIRNMNDTTVNEIWNLADGINSPSEKIAVELTTATTPAALKLWDENLQPLTLEELEEISNVDLNIVIQQSYRR